MIRLWSEWEVGEGNKIFATPEACETWLAANHTIAELAAQEQESIEDFIDACFNNGYFTMETVEVIA